MLTIKKWRLLSPLLLLTFVLLIVTACQNSQTVVSSGSIPGTTLLTYKGHNTSVNSARWSSDGKSLVSTSSDGSIQKWDATSGTKNWSTSIPNATSAVWSHKTNVVAVPVGITHPADLGKVVFLDGQDGHKLSTLTYTACSVFDVVWSSDDSTIAAACATGEVHIQKLQSSYVVNLHERQGSLNAVSWSPDGKRIALATYDSGHDLVRIFNVENLNDIREQPFSYGSHTATITSLAWSPDSTIIASASKNTVQVWNSWTLKPFFSYSKQTTTITHLAYSHNGKQIVSACNDDSENIFDALTGNTDLVYHTESRFVEDAEWSQDDIRIASVNATGIVQIWRAH